MIKILVVDDEPIIANGLFSLLSHENEDYDVYKAYSVPDAMQILGHNRMDIVLSDIKMPGMNGIDLLKSIKCQWPFCHVIFLSGYSDFSYVQLAMQLGADSYILKSQGDDEVLRAIASSVQIIQNELNNDLWNQYIQKELSVARPLMCRDFLWKILRGELTDPNEIDKQLIELGISLHTNRKVLLAGGRVDELSNTTSPTISDISCIEKIDAVFSRFVSERVVSENLYWNRRYFVWMIQPLSSDFSSVQKLQPFVEGMMEKVQTYCLEHLGLSISLIVDAATTDWKQLPSQFSHLKSVLTYQLGSSDEMLLGSLAYFKNAPNLLAPDNEHVDADIEFRNMEVSYDYRQRETFFTSLNNVLTIIVTSCSITTKIELYHRLCLFFLTRINNTDISKSYLSQFHGYETFAIPFEDLNRSIIPHFTEIAEWLFPMADTPRTERFRKMIYDLHDYIDNHLASDLSVNALAEVVYLNPVYLSRAYRRETGEKLSDHVLYRRLEVAKILLKHPEKRISEISSDVGFESPAHFSRVFKKVVGQTPQEYRESL